MPVGNPGLLTGSCDGMGVAVAVVMIPWLSLRLGLLLPGLVCDVRRPQRGLPPLPALLVLFLACLPWLEQELILILPKPLRIA
jgi:hypothetical protein